MTAAFPARLSACLQRFQNIRRSEVFTFHQENVLGTSFEFRVRTPDRQAAEEAEGRALAEIDRLEQIFSSFNPVSEFRRWQDQRGQPVQISPELMEVLLACDLWRKRSANTFNPATEVFSQLWKKAVHENRRPSPDELSEYVEQAAQTLWRLDPAEQTAVYTALCPLTLNAIAKGYIVDRACDAALRTEAVQGLVLNVGGDLCIRGDREEIAGVADPDNDAENAPPLACVRLRNSAMATSGDWRRGFQLGDVFYSHVIDPRSGLPVDYVRSATVIAPSAADSDALATIFSILSPNDSIVLADSLKEVGCLLIGRDGQVWKSAVWREREVSPA